MHTSYNSPHNGWSLVQKSEAKASQFSVVVDLSLDFHRVRGVWVILKANGFKVDPSLGGSRVRHYLHPDEGENPPN